MSEINNLNLLGTTYDIVDDSAIHERADWTETNTSSDAYIAHKPENLVQDANYVHTDNNYTTAEKTKLAGLEQGQAKELTSADYNYPTDNPTSVALWLLDAGIYMPQDGNVSVKATGSIDKTGAGYIYLVGPANSSGSKLIWCFMGRECNMYDVFSNGSYMSAKNISSIDVVNNLTSTSSTTPLSANQGKVLKDLIDSTVADETTARQAADTNLQTQIDAIVASSDVKDIVGTKADLNNYDTTTLGNNDIIKVLQDESQSSQTTYYRWSTSTSTFTLIGAEGPYYTKSATDTLLNDKADKSTTYTKTETDTLLNAKQGTLTAGSNIQISNDTISATDTTYSNFTGTDGTTAGTAGLVPAPVAGDEGKFLSGNGLWTTVSQYSLPIASANDLGGVKVGTNLSIDSSTGVLSATDTTYSNFTGTDGTTAGTAGLVPAPATTDAGKVLGADGTWVTGGPAVVQTTGTSTTNVMSQNATTSMIYASPSVEKRIRIGLSATNDDNTSIAIGESASIASSADGGIAIGKSAAVSASKGIAIGNEAKAPIVAGLGGSKIAIGDSAKCYGLYSVCIGHNTLTSSSAESTVAIGDEISATKTGGTLIGMSAAGGGAKATAIGNFANAAADGSVALGWHSEANTQGQVNIGISSGYEYGVGYNNSAYRLISGVYDPQSAHDAATKGYVDSTAAATVSSTDWSNLWQ